MLDRLAPLAHFFRVLVEPALHGFENMLMLPARDPSFLAGGAAREITTNEHGMASGVVYYDADGVEHFQPAEVVILACNAVGTARILLNSAPERFPSGLANSSGLVGKNLMFHPYARIAGYFDEALDGYRGPGNCIWSQEFYETDRSCGFVRGYTFEFSRGQGPVTGAVQGMQIGRLPWGAE
jgi:choline dehydrogenase-like flavoprotein